MHRVNVAPVALSLTFALPTPSTDGLAAGTQAVGSPQLIATLPGPLPTGLTVSKTGRLFVCYPRWADAGQATVVELVNGKPVAYLAGLQQGLVSVQSVVVDTQDRLWLLDTGSLEFGLTHPDGPKLVAVDLASNRVVQTITFPTHVARPTTYLNDVCFDPNRGEAGIAYITDAASSGPSGLLVVDLATGESWRRLNGHPCTRTRPELDVAVLQQRKLGLASAPDGQRLCYRALAKYALYSVDATLLADRHATDAQVAASVKDLGRQPASDGHAANRLYLTDHEQRGSVQHAAGSSLSTLVRSPDSNGPDTLSLAANGYLYFTTYGTDDLAPRGQLYRVRIDDRPLG